MLTYTRAHYKSLADHGELQPTASVRASPACWLPRI